MIFSPVKPEFDITAPHRFIQKITKDRSNLDPSATIYETECRPYKLNWLFVFCLSAVLTDTFKVSDQTVGKNYFALKDKTANGDVFAPFRTWHEGVRAGIQTIVSLYKIKLKGAAVWHGVEPIIANPPSGEHPVDDYFGQGVYDKAERLYNDLIKFEAGDEFDLPVVIGAPETPPAPKPLPIPDPEPVKKPEETKPEPVKEGEKPAPSGFKKTLLTIAGILGGASFLVGLFAPGWVKHALDLVVQLLKLFGGN